MPTNRTNKSLAELDVADGLTVPAHANKREIIQRKGTPPMALQSDTRWVIVEKDWISEEIIRVVKQISEDDDYGWRVARDRVNDHDQQLLDGRPGWANTYDGSWELLDVTKVGPETLELLNWLCRFDFSE